VPVPAATPASGAGPAAEERDTQEEAEPIPETPEADEADWRPVALDLGAAPAARSTAEAPPPQPEPAASTGNVGFRSDSELTAALRDATRVAQETRAAAPTERVVGPPTPDAAPPREAASEPETEAETPDLGTSDIIQPPETSFDSAHYRSVFEAFRAARRRVGEPVEGLAFEAFEKRLTASEQGLRQQHACRLVRFQVIIRDDKVTLRPQLIR
jgi:hypothetical protein